MNKWKTIIQLVITILTALLTAFGGVAMAHTILYSLSPVAFRCWGDLFMTECKNLTYFFVGFHFFIIFANVI